MVRPDRFPLTEHECRDRFRWTVTNSGLGIDAFPSLPAVLTARS